MEDEYEAYINLENTDDDHQNFLADYDALIDQLIAIPRLLWKERNKHIKWILIWKSI